MASFACVIQFDLGQIGTGHRAAASPCVYGVRLCARGQDKLSLLESGVKLLYTAQALYFLNILYSLPAQSDIIFMCLVSLLYKDLGFAKLDLERSKRRGIPEVVLCEGKSPGQVAEIMEVLAQKRELQDFALASRASKEHFQAVQKRLPSAQYFVEARLILAGEKPSKKDTPKDKGNITILTAGTSDIPVAEEAAVSAEILGNQITRIYDVGVAGIQRLLDNLSQIHKARVLIVLAGMDGALPAVVSGLVRVPVIAVPTSVGYGASFKGLAALLTMLNSCSPGMSVVNIDNGFGAAYLASLINQPHRAVAS